MVASRKTATFYVLVILCYVVFAITLGIAFYRAWLRDGETGQFVLFVLEGFFLIPAIVWVICYRPRITFFVLGCFACGALVSDGRPVSMILASLLVAILLGSFFWMLRSRAKVTEE